MFSRLKRLLLYPPNMMILSNIISAAISLVHVLLTAAFLTADDLGVIAIPATIGWLATFFWDIRISDIATKLHVAMKDPARQAASLRACLLISAATALLMAMSTFAITWFSLPVFTDATLSVWEIAAQSLVIGLIALVTVIVALIRLTPWFGLFSLTRVGAQIVYSTGLVLPLVWSPTLSTYYLALLATNIFSVLIFGGLLVYVMKKELGESLLRGPWRAALRDYLQQKELLWHSHTLGYPRMLNRAGDVLILSYFANDAVTGIYRLAKSLADGMGTINEALYNYYYPLLSRRLHDGEYDKFRNNIRRFLLIGFVGCSLLAAGAYGFLQVVEALLLHHRHPALSETTSVLIFSYAFTFGIYMWTWPLLMARKNILLLSKTSFVAAIVQATLIVLLCLYALPQGGIIMPALMALTQLVYNALMYIPLALWARRYCPEVWGPKKAASSQPS